MIINFLIGAGIGVLVGGVVGVVWILLYIAKGLR